MISVEALTVPEIKMMKKKSKHYKRFTHMKILDSLIVWLIHDCVKNKNAHFKAK